MIPFEEINKELCTLQKGQRGAIVERYADIYGVSTGTIYREIRRHYGPKKTVKRENKIDQNLIDEIARRKVQGMQMGLSERELSTEICIELMQNEGITGAQELVVSTVNRRLMEAGFRMREAIKMIEASYPNQQHQLDFSRSKYFQLWKYDANEKDYILKVNRTLFYKENEQKLRTWLVGITDAYSRISLARAVPATGESALIGIEFLNFVYNRDEDEHPLKYLPEVLKTDNGSFIKSKSVEAMLKALEVKPELTEPYKKHGIQKRESAWKDTWRRFELKIAVQIGNGGTISLTDYNYLLHQHMVANLERQHPVRNGSRGHIYKAGLNQHTQREITTDLREVAFKVYERVCDQSLVVSVNKEKFECPPFCNGQNIRVYKTLAGDWIGETIEEFHKPFVLKPTVGYVEIGDYSHRAPATYKQKIENEVKAEEKAKKAQKTAGINYLPPQVKKQSVKTKVDEATIPEDYSFPSIYKAKVYIAGQLEYSWDENLEELFGGILSTDPIYKNELDVLINKVKKVAINQ